MGFPYYGIPNRGGAGAGGVGMGLGGPIPPMVLVGGGGVLSLWNFAEPPPKSLEP